MRSYTWHLQEAEDLLAKAKEKDDDIEMGLSPNHEMRRWSYIERARVHVELARSLHALPDTFC